VGSIDEKKKSLKISYYCPFNNKAKLRLSCKDFGKIWWEKNGRTEIYSAKVSEK
jgi:hypothetical protein